MATMRIPKFEEIIYNLCQPTHSGTMKDSIELLQSHNILQVFEQEVLEAFNQILKATGTTPTMALLQQSIPQFRCQSTFEIKDMLGSIRLFIKDRLNKQVGNSLLSVADRITKEGVTEEVMDQLNKLVTTDATTLKYENVIDKIDDIYTKTLDKSGIKTQTRAIDDMIGGLKPGQLSTIAAFTGGGKSTFAVSLTHSAMEQGYNVCYLSLELSSDHLLYDLISRHSVSLDKNFNPRFKITVTNSDLKGKKLPNGHWDYIKETILPSFKSLPGKVYILDEQNIEAYTFFAFNNKLQEIEDLAMEETGHGIDLLVVDHIQMLQFSENNSRRSENHIINMWVNYFRSQCLDFLKSKRQIHVLMCAQINRQGWARAAKHDGMYDLTSLKEANEIETASSVIISLFSSEALSKSKEIKFAILKNRDGIKSEEASSIYCDFAHAVIGGDEITSDQEFATATLDDLAAASNSNVDISGIQQESLFEMEDDLPF